MAEPGMAMDKADLKKLLIKSKKDPVNCAVAQAKEAAFALILLDKIKQPKALSKKLEGDFPDGKNFRWGTAFVDVDDNPKLVIFTLNKPAPGIARKLVKSLKGTGFSKARIEFEDGTPPEIHDEEEGDDAPPAQAASPRAPAEPDDQAQPAAAAAPEPEPQQAAEPGGPDVAPPDASPNADQPAQAGYDQAELGRTLAQLIARVASADANSKPALTKLAADANTAMKAGYMNSATELIDQLRTQLDNLPASTGNAAPAAGAAPPPDAQAAQPNGNDPAAKATVTFAKSRLAWVATRKKIEAEVDKLAAALDDAYADDGIGDAVTAQFKQRVAPLLSSLDEGLADVLDSASNATDPQQRAKLVQDAKTKIGQYQQMLAQEPLFQQLQNNPFVQISVVPTLTATLTALSAALR